MAFSDVGADQDQLTGKAVHNPEESADERARRRQELVDAAVGLFVKNGYHETATRDIAKAAGWSVGALYEFVKSKSDILYRVCEVIHEETEALLAGGDVDREPVDRVLTRMVATYIRACDARQDVILLIYQEINCLSPDLRRLVIQNEEKMTSFFHHLIQRGVSEGRFQVESDRAALLLAHNIAVLGQMWAFRRWYVQKNFTLEEYIAVQTDNIMRVLAPNAFGAPP